MDQSSQVVQNTKTNPNQADTNPCDISLPDSGGFSQISQQSNVLFQAANGSYIPGRTTTVGPPTHQSQVPASSQPLDLGVLGVSNTGDSVKATSPLASFSPGQVNHISIKPYL